MSAASRTAGLSPADSVRHAHASWLLAGGTNVNVVKERLGHGSIKTTERYLHSLSDAHDEAVDASPPFATAVTGTANLAHFVRL